MDTSDQIAAVAIVVGLLSVLVNLALSEHNRRMARAAEDAAATAKELVELEEQKRRDSLKACLVFLPAEEDHLYTDWDKWVPTPGWIHESKYHEEGTLLLTLRNEGNGPAFRVEITCGEKIRETYDVGGNQSVMIEPGKTASLGFGPVRFDDQDIEWIAESLGMSWGDPDATNSWLHIPGDHAWGVLPLVVRFRDGLGRDELRIPLRLEWSEVVPGRVQAYVDESQIEYSQECKHLTTV